MLIYFLLNNKLEKKNSGGEKAIFFERIEKKWSLYYPFTDTIRHQLHSNNSIPFKQHNNASFGTQNVQL